MHQLILRPRTLFYRTDCTRRSISVISNGQKFELLEAQKWKISMIETSCLSKVRVLLFNTSFWTIQRILILLKWCGKYLWILKSLVHPQLWILFLVFSHLFSVPWGLIVILVKFVLMFVRKKVFARQHRNTVKSFFPPSNYNKIFLDILTHQILRDPKSKSKMAPSFDYLLLWLQTSSK